jgi:hypothetical protein
MATDASNEFIDVIAVLPYADIWAAHDFLVEVVGLESGGLVEHEGRVIHGEVRATERRFWLRVCRGRCGQTARRLVPTDEDYGQREYGLRDPEGHDWYIATSFAGS